MLAPRQPGDPSSLLIPSCKKQAVEGSLHRRGSFLFPPRGETFQPSQGGKPCHRSPGLRLCCQRRRGTAAVAERGQQGSKVTHGVIYRCYAPLQGGQGLELFLRSLHCFLKKSPFFSLPLVLTATSISCFQFLAVLVDFKLPYPSPWVRSNSSHSVH